MEYRELGGTGEMIPEIGLGTWRYRGGVAPLLRGLELGANFIDTAEVYGTEDVVGEALSGRRDGVFLATKVSGEHLRYEQVLRACDQSLKRLGVSTIDLYQVHWPNDDVPIGFTMKALEELVDAGKVRYIGVSNFSVQELDEAQAALSKHRIVSNQVTYSLMHRGIESDIESYYQPNKVTVIAYSPLAEGLLLSSRTKGYGVLQEIAQEVGKTPAQVAINWTIAKPGVVSIPKTDKVQRVDEDLGASGWQLTAEQLARLDAAYPVASNR